MASVIRRYQLPPCLIESMPAGSRRDPLLAKTEPVSARDSCSGITELGMGGNSCATASLAREQREHVRGTALQTHRSMKKERQEVLWAPDSPAAYEEDIGEAAVSLEVCSGAGGCPKEIVGPLEGHAAAASLVRPVALWRENPALEQVCCQAW